MMGPDRDSLARQYIVEAPSVPEVNGLVDLGDPSLLDKFLGKLCQRIKEDGLSSLQWVTGIHTEEIAASLQQAITEYVETHDLGGDDHCIVIKPSDSEAVQDFHSKFGIEIRKMNEIYNDSFVIVNEKAVIDVTPVGTDDGKPEFNDDETVVSLYIGLFNMLKNGASSP